MNRPSLLVLDDGIGPRRSELAARACWIVGAALLVVVLSVQPFRDGDVWWHLALGRLIAGSGIPAQEPFSFLPAAHAATGQGWLFEVLLAGLVGAGGAALASLFMGAAAVAAVVVAALAIPGPARVPGPWRAAAMLLSGLVLSPLLGVRSQVISVLGIAVVLLAVARWREGRSATLWWLPAVFLLWANMDSGFVVGLAVLAAAVLFARPSGVAGSASTSRRALLLVSIVCAAAALLNPEGPELYGSIATTILNPSVTQNIAAWASPDFHDWWLRLFEIEVLSLLVLWTVSGGPDRFDAVTAFGLLVAALYAQLNVAAFAIIAIPQLARYGSRAWSLRAGPRLGRIAGMSRRRLHPVATGAVLAVTAAGVGALLAPQLTPTASAAYESTTYPRAAASYVAAHLPGARLYTVAGWGGYLAYRFPGGRVVFLYDDASMFGADAVQSYLDIDLLQPDWTRALAAEHLEHAVLPDGSREAAAFHTLGWTVDCLDSESASIVMSAPPQGSPPARGPLDVPPVGARSC